ncbi:MAG: PDZ domain-containing protein [Armatimonadota bacterium]|nr:PDZ domain-containing protein [bacterium]
MYKSCLTRIAVVIVLTLYLGAGTTSFAQRHRPGLTPGTTNNPNITQRPRLLAEQAALYGPWLGMAVKDVSADGGQKVRVQFVAADSPADVAGLRVGDIITGLANKPVTDKKQFEQAVAELTVGTEYSLAILRGNEKITVAVKPITKSAAGTNPHPARCGSADINTLKYVLIDPKTRVATFIGKYDAAYATGPIPYADILKDVIANPYPSFSLEPTKEQRAQFDQIDRMITADIAHMTSDMNYCYTWAQKLMSLLLNDQSLAADNHRMFKNFGAAFNMSGQDLKRMYDGAAGNTSIPQNEVMELIARLLNGIGLSDVGNALLVISSGGTPDEIMRKMSEAMGLLSEFDALDAKADSMSADQLKNEKIILCMAAMCRRFEAPENEIQRKISAIRSGSESANLIVGYMGDQMGNFITNKSGAKMINGLVLSPELLSKVYNLPAPQSELVFTNVSADSQLGDVLFRADCRLKTLCTLPDVRDQVPAHLTAQEFIQKQAIAQNYDLPAGAGADIGHRLVPSDVIMKVSPAGDAIKFDDSHVKVIGWVRGFLGNKMDSRATDFINTVTPKYADLLTENYGEYAKVYPEWHEISEVAKLVALARWAKKNNYVINVRSDSESSVSLPKQIAGFWSAVFQTNGEKASLTLTEEGGASFSNEEGEDWLKTQPDVTVTSDVSKQLVASTVLASQAASTAISGDLEGARELADKSALAMTGEIDLTKLPSLDGIPVPGEPASYAAATSEVINQASECLKTMDTAQKSMAYADKIAATSPDEATTIRQQATQAQDNAQAKLNQLLNSVSTYKSDPTKASDTLVALQSGSTVVMPIGGSATTGGQTTAQGTTPALTSKPKDWSAQCSEWITELDKVNKQIESTRNVLLKLNASIQSDRKQFEEWEQAADEGFERCVGMASDVAVDFSAGALAERYEKIHELAKALPNKPADLIEKYRYLASLAKRLQEAKLANDLDGLAKREGKTETEIYEELRDGVGQLSGLFGLDKTVPGMVWKYGTYSLDMAYNLMQLRFGWKNVGTLEENNARYAEAVKKLAERMRELEERAKELRKNIESGEPGS